MTGTATSTGTAAMAGTATSTGTAAMASSATHESPIYGDAAAWQSGPGRLYDELAGWLASLAPDPLDGRLVLDLGAGTGSVSRACAPLAARVVAMDLSVPMLALDAANRPPAVAGDAARLPFSDGIFDAILAGFSLTHVPAVEAALAECRRTLHPGGALLATGYSRRTRHPAKAAVESVVREFGWLPPPWYEAAQAGTMERMGDPYELFDLAESAGFADARVVLAKVPTSITTPADLVAWRLGMPTYAEFFATLDTPDRAALTTRALAAVTAVAEPLRPELLALIAHR